MRSTNRKAWTRILQPPQKNGENKFNASLCLASDGTRLRSRLELRRYEELRLLQRSGQIEGLRTNTRWPLRIAAVELGAYESDFDYIEYGERVIEDCKGYVQDGQGRRPVTYRLFLLKKGLMQALYGITVREIHRAG